MSATLLLPDDHARADLGTFLGRAARIEEGGVRLQSVGSGDGAAVVIWVPVLRPQSILDDSPVVLGMRVIRARITGSDGIDEPFGVFDAAVPVRGMLDRLASDREQHRLEIPLPTERLLEAWTGITPPRADWEPVTEIASEVLEKIADDGIAKVASAIPSELGRLLVERARTEVWTAAIDVPGASGTGLVAGAAFAAHALGFLTRDPATLHRSGSWLRVSTASGHVLTRARRGIA